MSGRSLSILGASALAFASGGATAASMCKKVNGTFTLQSVTGPACTSAVQICATGEYRGDIAGTSSFTGTSLVPTADTPTTGVVLLTGDNAIATARGTVLTKDAIVLKTTGAGDFAEVDAVVGATGALTGITGTLRAQGTFTAAGGGEGRYIGEVCGP
jgi:hypothetical protein